MFHRCSTDIKAIKYTSKKQNLLVNERGICFTFASTIPIPPSDLVSHLRTGVHLENVVAIICERYFF